MITRRSSSARRWVLSVAASAALLSAAPAIGPAAIGPLAPQVAAAKSCSSGYTSATIGGASKCLRAGQFCARRYDRQYRRYGYRCTRYDARVDRYRLTR